jgi:hypothetical protein
MTNFLRDGGEVGEEKRRARMGRMKREIKTRRGRKYEKER